MDSDEEIPGESFGVTFTVERIRNYLEAFAPVDRVEDGAIDSWEASRENISS